MSVAIEMMSIQIGISRQVQAAQDVEIQPEDSAFRPVPQDLILEIFSYLRVIDLANTSRTCKVFNLVATADKLWAIQLHKLLPNVDISQQAGSPYTKYKQYQIVYSVAKETANANRKRTQQMRMRVEKLRGPNGFNGTINEAWRVLTVAIERLEHAMDILITRLSAASEEGIIPNSRFEAISNAITMFPSTPELKQYANAGQTWHDATVEYQHLHNQFIELVGQDFNGNEDSCAPQSLLGQALARPTTLSIVIQSFDNQQKFNAILSIAENCNT